MCPSLSLSFGAQCEPSPSTLRPRYVPIVEKKDEGTGKMSCLAAVELQLKIQVHRYSLPCLSAAHALRSPLGLEPNLHRVQSSILRIADLKLSNSQVLTCWLFVLQPLTKSVGKALQMRLDLFMGQPFKDYLLLPCPSCT